MNNSFEIFLINAKKIRTYVYSVNLEYEVMLELNQKNRPYQPYILKILMQIYFENFTRVDTNKAYAFCKQFYKEINRGYVFKSSKMSILQRYILIIFHEEAYQRYLNGEWNYESNYTYDSNVFYEVMEKVRYLVTLSECDKTKEPTIGQIQSVIRTMCNKWCYFPEEQALLCREVVSKVLEFMKELGIIDIIGDIVSFGQNADWLIRGEGKICYLIYSVLYFEMLSSKSSKYTYNDYLSIGQKVKKEIVLQVVNKNYKKQFNESIFDYYDERYQKMDETDVHFAIMRQDLWMDNRNGFEKNLQDRTSEYAGILLENC